MALLETHGLTAHYGDFQALFGLDVRLEAGEAIAIIGANGAGKSSLLRIMAGEDTDFLGEAKPLAGVRVGYLPQEPQLDPALDDAARVSGAGFGRRMGRIFGPLVAPAAASGAILVFLTAYNEVTVSALLWSTGNETIGTSIFNYEDGGYTTLAAAMSCVTVVATVALMAGLDRMGRRLPPGVVPWRI